MVLTILCHEIDGIKFKSFERFSKNLNLHTKILCAMLYIIGPNVYNILREITNVILANNGTCQSL